MSTTRRSHSTDDSGEPGREPEPGTEPYPPPSETPVPPAPEPTPPDGEPEPGGAPEEPAEREQPPQPHDVFRLVANMMETLSGRLLGGGGHFNAGDFNDGVAKLRAWADLTDPPPAAEDEAADASAGDYPRDESGRFTRAGPPSPQNAEAPAY